MQIQLNANLLHYLLFVLVRWFEYGIVCWYLKLSRGITPLASVQLFYRRAAWLAGWAGVVQQGRLIVVGKV